MPRLVSPAHRMAGLSLIELMVAVALGLLILTGLITVFVNSSAARNEVERTSRQIENGRYAVEILSDDLRLAGYYGEFNPAGADPVIALPTSFDPAVDSASDPCSTTLADRVKAVHFHVQGYAASNGGLSCILASYNYKAGTDVLVVRRVRTCRAGVDVGCEVAQPGKHYLQVSLCNEIPKPPTHVLALGSVAPTLKYKNCLDLVDRREYMVHIYFVSTDNGAGQDVPTLKRLEFTGAAWVPTALVEGIEQFHLEYGLDCAANPVPAPIVAAWPDGLTDVYRANPTTYNDVANCATAVNNWMNVMTVRFYVLARNIDASPGYKDEKTYNLGSATFGPFTDGYRRHVYTSLVRLTNPAAKRDRPL